MSNIDPDSEENIQQARDNRNYVGGLQLQAQHEREQDAITIQSMAYSGGSFVKSLAAACYRADADNLNRIKAAFPEIWEKYRP